MEAFAMQGDRIGALRVFEAWKVKLFDELGAIPSDILEGMAARLRRQTAEPTVTPAPVALCTDGRFVGRTEEYRALFEAWESTTQFNTRHVLITGESGIGKSTLALRFASAAALEGAAVARVQCFELEQRIAFGMIGALITNLLDRPSVSGTAPEALAEIARVVPRVKERFPHLPVPKASEGEAARLRFAEGTFALLEAIMEEQPLVLIVDDYPRSDEASLSVLHMLLRRATNERLMVVLAGRPPESDEPPQSARIRKAVSYLPMQRVDLVPMSDGDSEEMLAGLLSNVRSKPASPERRAIVRTAGGNPMALELLVQDWRKHGSAALAVLIPAMGEVPRSALEAIGYDRLIERLLPSLSPRTRLALYFAAILGPRLNELDYFHIIELTPPKTAAALSELIYGNILRNTGNSLEFVNELLRARIYLRIPDSVRVRLHDAVTNRLLNDDDSGRRVAGLEIAWHCTRARRYDEALPYLIVGANQAIMHGAPDEAARALTSTLSYMKGIERAKIGLLLAETYQEMGDWNEALTALDSISLAAHSIPNLSEIRDVLEVESRRHLGHYNSDELHSVLTNLLEKATSSRLDTTKLLAAFCVAKAGAGIRSVELMQAANDFISDVDLSRLTARDNGRVLIIKALANYATRSGCKGLREIQAADSVLHQESAMDTTYVETQLGLGAIACSDGRYQEAVAPFQAAFAAALRIGNDSKAAQAAANLALSQRRLGGLEESLKWSVEANARSQKDTPGSFIRVGSAAYCCFAHLDLGHSVQACQSFGVFQKEMVNVETPWVAQSGRLMEAEILWLMGKRVAALESVMNLLSLGTSALSIGLEGTLVRWMTVLYSSTGKPADILSLVEHSFAHIEKLDAMDQAEVLCSLLSLHRLGLAKHLDVSSSARTVLSRLPVTCSRRLKILGLCVPS
jgi:tetratricopeptide (TPR) repeat protein